MNKNNNIVERFTVSSSGDPSKGISTKVKTYFGDIEKVEQAFSPGYYAVLEKDDEVITLTPFKDGINKVIVGVVPNYDFDIPAGSRMMYTDNSQIILTKDGQVIISGVKDIKIQSSEDIEITNGNGTIKINQNGVIDLN